MAKVFDGSKFLNDRAVEIQLSNGKTFTVKEVMPETMEEVARMEKSESENEGSPAKVLATICKVPVSEFDGVGIVEMKGAIDFLLESLFDTKPQSSMNIG